MKNIFYKIILPIISIVCAICLCNYCPILEQATCNSEVCTVKRFYIFSGIKQVDVKIKEIHIRRFSGTGTSKSSSYYIEPLFESPYSVLRKNQAYSVYNKVTSSGNVKITKFEFFPLLMFVVTILAIFFIVQEQREKL